MTATIVLCVLSTLSFCVCARGIMSVVTAEMRSHDQPYAYRIPNRLRGARAFSGRAQRMSRTYWKFALFALAVMSLVGAVKSYIELFS